MSLNGNLPAAQLVVIPWDGRDQIRTYALPSLVRLNDAFRARFGHNLIINEGYRDYATQERYYKNPPSGAGTAAKPGTSNHGWGLAVDLKLTPAEYAWMLANAPAHGWINPLWARDGKGIEEPWHWEYVGAPAVVPVIVRTHLEGFLMALTDQQQLDLLNAVGRLEQLLGKTGETTGKVDRILQNTVDIRGGVIGLNRALAALDVVDEGALAAAVAPLLVPAVVAAVKADTGLTEAQVEAATKRAIRNVLGSLG